MKRKDDQNREPGDNAERRRRQFEASRGLSGRPELPLDEDGEDEPDTPPDGGEEREKDDGAGAGVT
jgi:hypothetical protein